MTDGTTATTLPVANGGTPTKRRVVVPTAPVSAAPADPVEPTAVADSSESDNEQGEETQDQAPVEASSEERPATQPIVLGQAPARVATRRGRPKGSKNKSTVAAEATAPAAEAKAPRKARKVATGRPAKAKPIDEAALGRLFVLAKSRNLTPDAVVADIRGMIEAWDALHAR